MASKSLIKLTNVNACIIRALVIIILALTLSKSL